MFKGRKPKFIGYKKIDRKIKDKYRTIDALLTMMRGYLHGYLHLFRDS
jgi:hypothetical protein